MVAAMSSPHAITLTLDTTVPVAATAARTPASR